MLSKIEFIANKSFLDALIFKYNVQYSYKFLLWM